MVVRTVKQMNIEYKSRYSEEQVQGLLAEYAATKDMGLRDSLVLQYKSLVESIGRRFTGSGEPLEDLAQEGFIGLITAADLYDASKGVKFSTYATHFIIGQIKHALRDRGKIIKEPAWLQELNHRLTRVVDSLYQELGRVPTDAEIADVMHVSEEMVADLLTTREVFKVSSLDADSDDPDFQGNDVENVKDDRYTTFQLPVEDKIVLETAVTKLKIVEQKVIQDFYYTGLTQTEIAKKLGISCNYVSHILRSGTKKLRRILTTDELMEIQMQLALTNRRTDAMELRTDISVVDLLTGLYNREYMENRLSEETIRASREKTELAYVSIKLFGLEDYGNQFGSLCQDDLACSLAQTVKDHIRRCDIAGRIGDWEFSLILPHTGETAQIVCDRVGDALCMLRDEMAVGRHRMDFTVWVGYSVYPSPAANARELIKRASSDAERVDQVKNSRLSKVA